MKKFSPVAIKNEDYEDAEEQLQIGVEEQVFETNNQNDVEQTVPQVYAEKLEANEQEVYPGYDDLPPLNPEEFYNRICNDILNNSDEESEDASAIFKILNNIYKKEERKALKKGEKLTKFFVNVPQDKKLYQYISSYLKEIGTNIVDDALNSHLLEALEKLAIITDGKETPFMANGTYAGTLKNVDTMIERLCDIPELYCATEAVSVALERNNILSESNGTPLSPLVCEQVYQRIQRLTPLLDSEQKASAYLRSAELFMMAQDGERHAECLQKVVAYTSKFENVDYCCKLLPPTHRNFGAIRKAYRRVLEQAEDNDKCNIYMALAKNYQQDFENIPGMPYPGGDKRREELKLEKAENCYLEALKYAPENEKIIYLKELSDLQLDRHNINGWAATRTEMAYKYMDGESRCNELVKIGSRLKENGVRFLERAIQEAEVGNFEPRQKLRIVTQSVQELMLRYQDKEKKEKLQTGFKAFKAKLAVELGNGHEDPLERFPFKGNSTIFMAGGR